MIYRFSPKDLEQMYNVIRKVHDSTFIAAYMSQVNGEFFMDTETKKVLDEGSVEYDLYEEIDGDSLKILYAGPEGVKCAPYEENIKSFVLAHSPESIGVICIGVDCEDEFSSDLMMNGWQYFHWQVPGSEQKHLWRMFFSKDEAAEYVGHFFHGFEMAKSWVDELPGKLTPAPGSVTLNPKMRDLRRKR